eukprot:6209075-Pleurochrysis_carterae.AAC.1
MLDKAKACSLIARAWMTARPRLLREGVELARAAERQPLQPAQRASAHRPLLLRQGHAHTRAQAWCARPSKFLSTRTSARAGGGRMRAPACSLVCGMKPC